jgi:hypothetical protein
MVSPEVVLMLLFISLPSRDDSDQPVFCPIAVTDEENPKRGAQAQQDESVF